MNLALGIDTGGTYTDAVLLDRETGTVRAGNKALTTRHNLSIGIEQAVSAVLDSSGEEISPDNIALVGLSTTLATNAIVEGQGAPVCLLLIGYDPDLIRHYGFERELVTPDVVYIPGGHNGDGDELTPLDEAALEKAVRERQNSVEAFAVSAYFSVRNPAHELRAKALIEQWTNTSGTPAPVTCGHELTTRLDAVRRATTTALNARLIPLLHDLILTVRRILKTRTIAAPLMIVKGDGSLVSADWAAQRPVETILSGPAASVVGAWHLAGRKDVWVVDVGGTTSDIAVLRNGRPRLNPEGARVGGWRTMVETADVHTAGLGGDSHVRLEHGELAIGPRRVVPLSLLAHDHPDVLRALERQLLDPPDLAGQFLLHQGRTGASRSSADQNLIARLEPGPQSLSDLAETLPYGMLDLRQLRDLEAHRLVLRAGFTPTDALHALGRFTRWNAEAARLSARLLAGPLGLSLEEFCERVIAGVSRKLTFELVHKVLTDEGCNPEHLTHTAPFLSRATNAEPDSDLECRLSLRHPLVAVGAPVQAYLPQTARYLNTELIVPEHADVANAIGAVAGGVVQTLKALVRPIHDRKPYRLHLPDGVLNFAGLEEAVAHAQQVVPEQLHALARQAGANGVDVRMDRKDLAAPVKAGYGDEVFVETELIFTAVGRPGLAS